MLKMFLTLAMLLNISPVFSQAAISSPEVKLIKTEALRLWQKRVDQQSLEESLSKFEFVHQAHPDDLEILTYLSRGHYLLGELHHTNNDLKKKAFEKARDYGQMGMETNPEYKKLAQKDVKKAIENLTLREVPVMYWAAAALGKWSRLNGIMSSLKYKDQITTTIEQVGKLNPNFYYGAVPRYWGGFYAVAPRIAGGSMKKSKENFKKSMEMAPEYLGTKVLYAELYLTEKDDKKEFKKQLHEVITAPNGPADLEPENTLEKKKAKMLLEKIDSLF